MAHFGRGARGALISLLREKLGLQPSPVRERVPDPVPALHDRAFDEFDEALEARVRDFQKNNGATQTGLVDEALFTAITGEPWPSLFRRALMVVGSIENHGYFKFLVPDKQDPVGLTAGIIGFTAMWASLMEVLVAIDATVVDAALTANSLAEAKAPYAAFASPAMIKESSRVRRDAARTLFYDKHQRIDSRWQEFLRTVLRSPSGIAAQEKIAEGRFAVGEQAAAANGLTSEYGKLLTFSINVQSRLTDQIVSSGSDRERRIAVALQHTGTVTNKADFEARHVVLARGFGFVHGRFVDLTRWGLTDTDAAPAGRSRVLSLGLCGDDSMAALGRFDRAAVNLAVVQDRVMALTAVTTVLAAEKVPFANAKHPDINTPDLSRAWRRDLARTNAATRRSRVSLLIALDDEPIDCLVMANDRLARSTQRRTLASRFGPLSLQTTSARLATATVTTLEWNGKALSMPLSLRMSGGLVVLYLTQGISRGDSFGLDVFEAIRAINGTPPLVLGWHGAIKLPGRADATPEEAFLTAVKGLMGTMTLRSLIAAAPEAVIQAWGAACHATFDGKKHPALWRAVKKKKKAEVVTSACAAIGPTRNDVWLAMAKPDLATGIFMERMS